MKLEEIKKDALLRGIIPGQVVKVVSVEMVGEDAVTIVYRDNEAKLGDRMLFRADETEIEAVIKARPLGFDADAHDFKLAAEALRIHLAHLFDPLMAIHTSNIEPLPHQITAVYESMLKRQPLKFVLADDPGAGKTIMAGLLIRELMIRGDLKRCLIVSPGNLVDQWQEELDDKFGLVFEIFTRQMQEATRSGNPFNEKPMLIARLDQLARNDELKARMENTDWDLIVVDEAHKMSAHWFGEKFNKTRRYVLGEILAKLTRHFLLMTATPHSGKEEDFQAFMALVDPDRFYGNFKKGDFDEVDVSDLMRRMIKEDLFTFEAKKLFPERWAYTVDFKLSDQEMELYDAVTDYVRNEMARADKLNDKRKGTVGLALTILQRRLASSPKAIFESLDRRLKKMLRRLNETTKRHTDIIGDIDHKDFKGLKGKELDEYFEDLPESDANFLEEQVLDQATASRTVAELKREVEALEKLLEQARYVLLSKDDRKWKELSKLLQDNREIKGIYGEGRKLIIFTEHRDTLNYLKERIADLLGRDNAVETIYGGLNRDLRRKAQENFKNNKDIVILLATDAAGEGVNLQNANLMINYDLPWNPNRLEQRFGRIHRIGQTEVCHLWNLVAMDTMEGGVFLRLFEKLEIERKRLDGKVFDILGQVLEGYPLKDLLIEAIRYGNKPEVKAKLEETIDGAVDEEHLREITERNALSAKHMNPEQVFNIKEEMEKAQALKLQPHFVQSFFEAAFGKLNGDVRKRETGRFEIAHVPAAVRKRGEIIGRGQPVVRKYHRICFDKKFIRLKDKPPAGLLAPGHPLMDAVIDLILEEYRHCLNNGTALVNRRGEGMEPAIMFMLDHSVRESLPDRIHGNRTISRKLKFVMIDRQGNTADGGPAPYLDLDVPNREETALLQKMMEDEWLKQDLEKTAMAHAVRELVPRHFNDIKERRSRWIDKTLAAVHQRLTKAIAYSNRRYEELKVAVREGKQPEMQLENARRRVEELTERLKSRKQDLEGQRNMVSASPIVMGGALVVPQGLLDRLKGKESPTWSLDAAARKHVEILAMKAVEDAEKRMGFITKDVHEKNLGWDIESKVGHGDLRFIEVKGRANGQTTITVTKNEILAGFNQPERYFLAIVIVDGNEVDGPYYLKMPFENEPGFGICSINYDLKELLSKAEKMV